MDIDFLEQASKHKGKEDRIKICLANACNSIGDINTTETEWETGDGPVDVFLPLHRVLIECKAPGKAGPDAVSGYGETQFEQLKRYILAQRRAESEELDLQLTSSLNWTGILTDGSDYWVYQWSSDLQHDSDIKERHRHLTYKSQPNEIRSLLKASIQGEECGKPLIPRDPSSIFETYESALDELWNKCKHLRHAKTQKKLWGQIIQASGMMPNDGEVASRMFIKHCFLVAIARSVTNTLIDPDQSDESVRTERLSDGYINWISKNGNEGKEWLHSIQSLADAYDWKRRRKDVLRTLYQTIIPKTQRKIYGEYYTPDWVAEMLAEKILDDEWVRKSVAKALRVVRGAATTESLKGIGVLDPACGSGTFLYHSAKKILKAKELSSSGVTPKEKSMVIMKLVHGIDIHPVAIEFSKATLLRSLPRPQLLDAEQELQVWQGDSLLVDWGINLFRYNKRESGYRYIFHSPTKRRQFGLPKEFVHRSSFGTDIRQFVEEANNQNNFPTSLEENLSDESKDALHNAFNTLSEICGEEGNGVWRYHIFNSISPSLLAVRKVDRILANPPWVRVNEIQVSPRKEAFEDLAQKLHIWMGGKHATSFDIGAIFVIRCAENYLVDIGQKSAWVLNYASTIAESWSKFRKVIREKGSRHGGVFSISFNQLSGKNAPFTGAKSCTWIQGTREKGNQILRLKNSEQITRETPWSVVSQATELIHGPKSSKQSPSEYVDFNPYFS